jgi:hypothetical protein
MGSYTPGLKVTPAALLRFDRRLPLQGEVIVKEGQRVTWDQVVARTDLPGRVEMVNLANKLGVGPSEVAGRLLKPLGSAVEKGEILAKSKGLFGYFQTPFRSPIAGRLESISLATGQVILRSPPRPISMNAYVDGVIERVESGQGVTVKTFGALIQGIFGLGGETSGQLECVVSQAGQLFTADEISEQHKGKVLVVGKIVTAAMVRRAAQVGVAALVAGGVDDADIRDLLGYDLGVAITGNERLGVTVLITEGFGALPIAQKTFGLLKERCGHRASICGATQIRAGVIRPEIIITSLDSDWEKQAEEPPDLELALDAPVRLIREPYFGHLARVVGLPVQPERIPSGARVRVAEVELSDGSRFRVPRANLELIEG